MARTRSIKPSFFKNEFLAECEPMARLLFVGLWTLADRDGRLELRPRRIELVAKGMIVQAGEGKTASGRRAVKNLAKAEKTHAASSRSLFDAEAVA